MERLAIIPARGGSKRLPRKNKLDLGGKPLVQHTIESVVNSNGFSKIILSSDDPEILDKGQPFAELDCELRDDKLAGDTVKVIELVKQIARRPGYSEKFEQIGLFLPTCPFRTANDICEGLKLLQNEDYSVVSVSEMKDPIQLSLTIDSQTMVINPHAVLNPSPLVSGQTRSQDFQTFYRVNGGFYIAWMSKFLERDNFFQGQVKAYPMESIRSIDIDHKHELEIANLLIEKGYVGVET